MVDTLTRADMACYTAKKEGRNRIHTGQVAEEPQH
jgi:PleD family two-component response regulator